MGGVFEKVEVGGNDGEGILPERVECHAVLLQNGHQIVLASAAEEIVLALIDAWSDVTFLVANVHPFTDLFGGVVRETKLD